MDKLLRNEFIACHYKLNQSEFQPDETEASIRGKAKIEKQECSAAYFEIADDNGCLKIYTEKNKGTGKFANPRNASTLIINYDKFLTSLPNVITRKKKRCDAILCTNTKTDFLLAEVKNSRSHSANNDANKQLSDTLKMLLTVPEIEDFIKTFSIKRYCRFIKKTAAAPEPLIATRSFSRRSLLSAKGDHLSNPEFEALGFEMFRCAPGQSCRLG